MNQDISLQQNRTLVSFSEQRDSLLSEISQLKIQHDFLKKENQEMEKERSILFKEVGKMQQAVEMMESLEEERSLLISRELAEKLIIKQELISSISLLEKQKEELQKDVISKLDEIKLFRETMDYQIKQVKGLNELVLNTVRINTENTNDLNHLIVLLKQKT